MKKSIRSIMLGSGILLCLAMMFTSCEGEFDDLFGEWSRPTGNVNSGNEKPSGNIAVTSITLNETTLEKKLGDVAVTLTATVKPDDATDKTVTWSSEDPAVASVNNGLVSILSEGTTIITATANDGSGVKATCTITVSKPGLLAGKFSVSATKQVRFSQGNLQATYYGTTWIWAFAEHQWDYIGGRSDGGSEPQTGNNYITGSGTMSADGTVDLFGWSTAATYYGIHNSTTSADYSGDFVEWGKLAITNGGNTPNYGWRTLSATELEYLFITRTASTVNSTVNARFAKAKVNNIYGVILFPDSYTHPDGVTPPTNINVTDDNGWTDNNYSSAQWAQLEAAGAVFLPASGDRTGTYLNSDWKYSNYWSSTPSDDGAFLLPFRKDNMPYIGHIVCFSRYPGYSIRLVYDVK